MARSARCAPWGRTRPLGSLSVVLEPSRRVRDGEVVEVVLGSGRTFAGPARLLDDGKIRVMVPVGVS